MHQNNPPQTMLFLNAIITINHLSSWHSNTDVSNIKYQNQWNQISCSANDTNANLMGFLHQCINYDIMHTQNGCHNKKPELSEKGLPPFFIKSSVQSYRFETWTFEIYESWWLEPPSYCCDIHSGVGLVVVEIMMNSMSQWRLTPVPDRNIWSGRFWWFSNSSRPIYLNDVVQDFN